MAIIIGVIYTKSKIHIIRVDYDDECSTASRTKRSNHHFRHCSDMNCTLHINGTNYLLLRWIRYQYWSAFNNMCHLQGASLVPPLNGFGIRNQRKCSLSWLIPISPFGLMYTTAKSIYLKTYQLSFGEYFTFTWVVLFNSLSSTG